MNLCKNPFVSVMLLVFALSVSFEGVAKSCMATDELFQAWSDQYKEKIQIKSQKSESGYTVEISFPASIDGRKFKNIWLFKGEPAYDATQMDYDFDMPLDSWEGEGSTMHSIYGVKPFLAKDNYIEISYGEGCGISVQYPVKFE